MPYATHAPRTAPTTLLRRSRGRPPASWWAAARAPSARCPLSPQGLAVVARLPPAARPLTTHGAPGCPHRVCSHQPRPRMSPSVFRRHNESDCFPMRVTCKAASQATRPAGNASCPALSMHLTPAIPHRAPAVAAPLAAPRLQGGPADIRWGAPRCPGPPAAARAPTEVARAHAPPARARRRTRTQPTAPPPGPLMGAQRDTAAAGKGVCGARPQRPLGMHRIVVASSAHMRACRTVRAPTMPSRTFRARPRQVRRHACQWVPPRLQGCMCMCAPARPVRLGGPAGSPARPRPGPASWIPRAAAAQGARPRCAAPSTRCSSATAHGGAGCGCEGQAGVSRSWPAW